ncbi:MAG: NADH-quinone oxidoreductase subunit H [Desulfobulbaceae bacterium]
MSVSLLLIALLLAPFLALIPARVKAWFSGRRGPGWLQNHATLVKLARKIPVYSTTTTFVFRLSPVVTLAASLAALCFLPLAGRPPLFAFSGDVVLLFYLLGLARFFMISAALDTGSPFEGMGAAREALFGALAEATVFVILILFERLRGGFSLSSYLAGGGFSGDFPGGAVTILVVIALFMVLLTENARVPVDDPTTHLELTMIHEVMILDHSGPDFALIEAGSWLKLLFYSGFIADLVCPFDGSMRDLPLFFLATVLVYLLIGLVESITARYRLHLVPKFILTSFALAFFCLIITMELPL